MGKTIFFFSQGNGTAHAERDVLIADRLAEQDNDIQIRFASYGDGYRALSTKGKSCQNLGLFEHDRLIRIGEVIRDEKPDLVVSDEELLVLPLAKILQVPSLLLTNWFPPRPEYPAMSYFADPKAILLANPEESFLVPAEVRSQVHFVGPLIRLIDSSPEAKHKARKELQVPEEVPLVFVTAGKAEKLDTSFFQSCLWAFKQSNRKTWWIAIVGELKEELEKEVEGCDYISLREYLYQPSRYMLAANLVIMRGGYFTLWELASLGIPSICIPCQNGDFWIQNLTLARHLEKLGSTIVMKECELTEEKLAEQVDSILACSERWEKMSQAGLKVIRQLGDKQAAEIILSLL